MTMIEPCGPSGDVLAGGVARLLDGLRDKCGLKRDDLLERKVLGALRQQPPATCNFWIDDLVARAPDDPAWLAFVESVTVHETYFFRDPTQLGALVDRLLPDLLAERARHGRRLKVWSAGCASGEEAYTVAMLLSEALAAMDENPANWDIVILGSDISRAVVARAQEGVYGGPGLNAFRRMPPRFMRHFTALEDGHSGRKRIDPALARLVRFRQHNLMDATPPDDGFDIVLCRNVFIYFDDPAQHRAVANLRRALAPGGHLLLGVTDRLAADSGFERLSHGMAMFYRRREDGP